MTIAEPEIQTSTPAPPPEPGPLLQRIVETITSPGELFRRFGAESTPWLGPVLITAAVSALFLGLIPKAMIVELAREQLQAAAQPGQQAPDAETAATFMRVSMVIGALLVPFVATFIMAGLLKLVGALGGGEATYGQYLGVYGHSLLIAALGGIITFPILIMAGDMTRQLTPALLLPDADPNSFLVKLLMQFGVFSLWQYAVIGIGVIAVNRGRVSAAAAWAGVAGLYLLGALLATVPALMQG